MALNGESRRRRLPEERPQQILEAALEIFGECGLADARLDDIAKRAGVAKGTIYLYFPNKEALFKEMIRQTVIDHLERAERAVVASARASAHDQVREYVRQWWTLMRSPPYQTVHRLVIGELHRFPELVEFYWREVVLRRQQAVLRLIQKGVDSGEYGPVDPVVAGRILASMFASHALWASTGGICRPIVAMHDDDQVFEQLMDFFFHAVRATAPSPAPAHHTRARQ